jgi:5-methylcytosine-specific restriction endonuclease McrA
MGHPRSKRSGSRNDSSCLACALCGSEAIKIPRRGPSSRFCPACLKGVKSEQGRARKKRRQAENRDKIHAGTCGHCSKDFVSASLGQKFCSPLCRVAASRKRVAAPCEACGKTIDKPGRYSRRHFCSRECFLAVHSVPPVACVGCGAAFKPTSYKYEWQGKNKYCCRECYLDDRWGKDRPARKSTPAAVDRACRRSLATSLRKRCKHYGVPFDPACTREAVCERDGWTCQRCGVKCHVGRQRFSKKTRKISRRSAEHDHIVPLSRRDPAKGNTFDNSQCLCRKCNLRKSARGGGQMRLALVGC